MGYVLPPVAVRCFNELRFRIADAQAVVARPEDEAALDSVIQREAVVC